MSLLLRFSPSFCFLILFTMLLSGCGKPTGTLTGEIMENDKPRLFKTNEAALQLTLVTADGKFDNSRSYTAVVNEDGTFEVVASGGELTPGNYQVALLIKGNDPKYKAFAAPESAVRREVKQGANHFVIDLAKP